jgi:hypothetical protein
VGSDFNMLLAGGGWGGVLLMSDEI